jgi:hypothetical protein
MAEYRQPLSEVELERRLSALGRQVAFPATPPLALRVQQRLAAVPARRHWLGRPWARRFAFAVAALVLAFVVVLIAAPNARTALAGRLGLPGIEIRQVPSAPRLPVTATPSTTTLTPAAAAAAVETPIATATPELTATPLSLGQRLHLGQQVTLAVARQRVSFPILLPAALGTPDAIYVGTPPPDGEVTLVYRPRSGLPVTSETGVGLLLSEFQASLDVTWFYKGVGPDTQVVAVTVNGQPGFWLEGIPHFFRYLGPGGQYGDEALRLAGNTLIWTQGNVTLRLESALSKGAALTIAGSTR